MISPLRLKNEEHHYTSSVCHVARWLRHSEHSTKTGSSHFADIRRPQERSLASTGVRGRTEVSVRAVEKDSGLLTTDFVSMPAGYNNARMNQWVFPPGGFLATWAGLRMNLSVLVTEPQPGKTQVSVRTHYEAFENNVSKSWVVCQSNGSLENGILTRISQQLPTKP
jgi:hypothetical protein